MPKPPQTMTTSTRASARFKADTISAKIKAPYTATQTAKYTYALVITCIHYRHLTAISHKMCLDKLNTHRRRRFCSTIRIHRRTPPSQAFQWKWRRQSRTVRAASRATSCTSWRATADRTWCTRRTWCRRTTNNSTKALIHVVISQWEITTRLAPNVLIYRSCKASICTHTQRCTQHNHSQINLIRTNA